MHYSQWSVDGAEFARSFQQFMEAMTQTARESQASPVRDLLEGHVGPDCSNLPVVHAMLFTQLIVFKTFGGVLAQISRR